MKILFKRFSQFSFGTILGAIISLIQVPILTHFLLPQEYGRAGLFRTLIVQIPVYLYLGLDHSYSREYYSHDDKNYLVKNSMVLPIFNSLIILLISLIWSSDLSEWLFGSPEYEYIIWLSGIWIIFLIFERFILLTLRMEDKAKEYSLFTLLTKVNSFVISILLILIGMNDFRVIVFGLIIGQLVADILLIIKYKKYVRFSNAKINTKFINQMLVFGIPQMISITLTAGLNALDNVFINIYSNSTDLGIYNVGLSIVSIVGIVRTAFTTFWLPTAYKWEKLSKSIDHYKAISEVLLLFLTICFYLLLIFKPIIKILISEVYFDVIDIIPLLTLPHIFATLSETTTLGILFSKKTHLNIFVGISVFVTSIAFNILLTPILGYKGAAISSALAYCVYYISRTYFSKSTGFYFEQRKHIVSVILMLIMSVLNVIQVPFFSVFIFISLVLTIYYQYPIYREILDIKNNPEKWDFS